MPETMKNILIRYCIATAGLALVATGVALSIISDLGTSPISCPPYVLALNGGLTVGQYTAMMHLLFILVQAALLRKNFRIRNLMQIAAAVVFGALTDLAIMATSPWLTAETYTGRLALMVLSVILTSAGISIEVRARAWMLAGEMTVAAIAETGKMKFRNVKIAFDISLVIIAAAMSMLMSGHLLGDGQQTVIREGTLVSALFTGYLMRFLDPLTDRLLRRIIPD